MGGKKNKNKNKSVPKDQKDIVVGDDEKKEEMKQEETKAVETPVVEEPKPKVEDKPVEEKPVAEKPKEATPEKTETTPKKEEPVVEKKEEPVAKIEEPVAKKEEPAAQMEDSQADQQSSGFEVLNASVQKSQDNIAGKPSEVRENYINSNQSVTDSDSPKKKPNVIGIKGFTDSINDQPEIDSPMRKKKKGLDKLKISQEVCENPAETKFDDLEKKFEAVLTNFSLKKAEFENLKKMGKQELFNMK